MGFWGFWSKRLLAAAAVVLAVAVVGFGAGGFAPFDSPVSAQTNGEVPGGAIGGISDSDTWRSIRQGRQGYVSLLDKQAGVLIQSEGDNWRSIRNGPISVWGAWLLAAVIVFLAAFFLLRGRIRIEAGFSGRLIKRFTDVERFSHWLTATSFCLLGITGLNMLYGRYVVKPLIGADNFATLTMLGKYSHNFLGFAFMVGLVLILILWVRDNIPDKNDLTWLAQGGGLLSHGKPLPVKKFNAGQKVVFWMVIVLGGLLAFTGLSMVFPFTFSPFSTIFAGLDLIGFDLPTALSPIREMQLIQITHAILSLVMIAMILAHIYIGWIGMEGAYDAMGSGYVDENWAREHHALWVEETGLGGTGELARREGDG